MRALPLVAFELRLTSMMVLSGLLEASMKGKLRAPLGPQVALKERTLRATLGPQVALKGRTLRGVWLPQVALGEHSLREVLLVAGLGVAAVPRPLGRCCRCAPA